MTDCWLDDEEKAANACNFLLTNWNNARDQQNKRLSNTIEITSTVAPTGYILFSDCALEDLDNEWDWVLWTK